MFPFKHFSSLNSDEEDEQLEKEQQKIQKQMQEEMKQMLKDQGIDYDLDERSGDEAPDSDLEFEELMKVQKLLDKINDNLISEDELYQSLVDIIKQLSKMRDLMEFESGPLQLVMEQLSRELPNFGNDTRALSIAKHGYLGQMHSDQLWMGFHNALLVNFNNNDADYLIQLLYFMSKTNSLEIELHEELMDERLKHKVTRLLKSATRELLFTHFKEELENRIDYILSDSERVIQLGYLLNYSQIKGIEKIYDVEEFNKIFADQLMSNLNSIDTMNKMLQTTTFDKLFDAFRLLDDLGQLNYDNFSNIFVLMYGGSKKQRFFYGKMVSYGEVNRILKVFNKFEAEGLVNDESRASIKEGIRKLLQKAISASNQINVQEVDDLSEISADQDLMSLFGLNYLSAFEHLQFNSQAESQKNIELLHRVVIQYQATATHAFSYLESFSKKLMDNILDSEDFDKHLGVPEYKKLSSIVERIYTILVDRYQVEEEDQEKIKERIQHLEKLLQVKEYLEKKVFNYTSLNNL